MIIAIPYNPEDGTVFLHTGRTECFRLYEIEDNKVVRSYLVPTNGLSHHYLVVPLMEHHVDFVLAGHFGQGMKDAMNAKGIAIFGGVAGNTDDIIRAYLEGTLEVSEEPLCQCHHHDEDQ